MRSLTLSAAAAGPSPGRGAGSANEIFHVAIFRFAKEHVNDAIAAFRALASVSTCSSRSGASAGRLMESAREALLRGDDAEALKPSRELTGFPTKRSTEPRSPAPFGL